MAPVKLPCVAGGDCTFETVELDYEYALAQQQMHMQYAHNTGGGGSTRRPEKFPRPEIKLDSAAEDWAEFLVEWGQYKAEYDLRGPGLIRQLYACCSDEMKTSVSRLSGGTQFSKTEEDLLKVMKGLAVRYTNPAVFVQQFLHINQQQDEGVRHFLTRLKGVASRCNFSEQCSGSGCQYIAGWIKKRYTRFQKKL